MILYLVVLFVNGEFCKDPIKVKADDFFFSGLNKPGNTSNQVRAAVTAVNVANLPGLNTLGISMARIDFEPKGLNPPHEHPRAAEILLVLKGTLEVGFITSNPDNRLFAKILHEGDVFVVPFGLIHFQYNVGKGDAVAIAALTSQNPGVITIGNAVFGSKPPINDDILKIAFQIDNKLVDYHLQSRIWPDYIRN
ncbi:Germin [Macleaya cordata]|uniref:Germin-like protein n=1 Tax=Macleaya cordata TaxID=56857 RepID=A0A200QEQ0_MACCD|nr:Germin [Macleaya cordata]